MNSRSRTPHLATLLIVLALLGSAPPRMAHAVSLNGAAGSMPAYYDAVVFTINFKFLSSSTTVIKHNSQTNIIWQSDPGLPGGKPFISVINAIPADGFNPLWVECQITFNPGHTPRQFFSDDEVNAAAASGEITVTDTGELYRCSVVGMPSRSSILSGTAPAAASPAAAAGVTQGWTWGRVKAAFR
jgi:hypothetical protein